MNQMIYISVVRSRSDYYPFGTRTGSYEETGGADGRWRFSGKEWQAEPAGLPLLDFGARMYDPATAFWLSQDPMAEKYPFLSPYSYCAGDPVNLVDPDGRSTWVVSSGNGYTVVDGGNRYDDGDLNIYLCYVDENGKYVNTGLSVGRTLFSTSFFDTDEGSWVVNARLDPNDESGVVFLGDIASKVANNPIDYAMNATAGKKYDFKVTKGGAAEANMESGNGEKSTYYLGMPIEDGVYVSARDVGNMAAGYVAGYNGISWLGTRLAFDLLQTIDSRRKAAEDNQRKPVFVREGLTSRNAQYYGWIMGKFNSPYNRFEK